MFYVIEMPRWDGGKSHALLEGPKGADIPALCQEWRASTLPHETADPGHFPAWLVKTKSGWRLHACHKQAIE